MDMVLPLATHTFTGSVNGEWVHKETFSDGSYAIGDEHKLIRHFPDGKKQTYESELVPVDDERPEFGMIDQYFLREEEQPDGTKTKWDEYGNVTYHETKGVEDTAVYLAGERVKKMLQGKKHTNENKHHKIPVSNKMPEEHNMINSSKNLSIDINQLVLLKKQRKSKLGGE